MQFEREKCDNSSDDAKIILRIFVCLLVGFLFVFVSDLDWNFYSLDTDNFPFVWTFILHFLERHITYDASTEHKVTVVVGGYELILLW